MVHRFPSLAFPSLAFAAAGLFALASCRDLTTHFDATPKTTTAATPDAGADMPEDCPASAEWLPHTPATQSFEPLPHPSSECPFYRGGWQNFLLATEPDATGELVLRSYPTIDDVFVSKTQHAPRNTAQRAWLGDVKQAGGRQILVDRYGHAITYGIHVNDAFARFVAEQGLRTKDAVVNADPKLFLPAGLVEFKSAWMDIDPADGVPDAGWDTYITTVAWVSTLHQDPITRAITEDKNHPRQIKVALLALHVVFALPGHPELVWMTFEHVDQKGAADSAPASLANPDAQDPANRKRSDVVCATDFALCRAGTAAQQGNMPHTDADLTLDDAKQSFPQRSDIYRLFPASKSDGTDPDDAVVSLNANMAALFEAKAKGDKRKHYRLVGGQWLDKPAAFTLGATLLNDSTNPLLSTPDQAMISQNGERKDALGKGLQPADDLAKNGTDSPFSILAGEDRMSSTAMESFTQAPNAFPSCFSCHNTEAVSAFGIPAGKDATTTGTLLGPKLLNVSHVFSQFVLEESAP